MSLWTAPDDDRTRALGALQSALLASAADLDRVVERNLREEDRLPESTVDAFHVELLRLRANGSRANSALVDEACRGSARALPVPPSDRWKVQGDWHVHVTFESLISYGLLESGYETTDTLTEPPPSEVQLRKPLGILETGNARSTWVSTFTRDDDAKQIRDRLGLSHVRKNQWLIRLTVNLAQPREVWIPSALDGGIGLAWRRPPRAFPEPWGLTIDLSLDSLDAGAREPELLVICSVDDSRRGIRIGQVLTHPPATHLKSLR